MMRKESKIYVAGHRGLVGSALLRALEKRGYRNLLLRTRKELDLMDRKKTGAFFEKERPEYVFLAAAKVGGILANSAYPADFIYENLAVQNNVIRAAYEHKAKKLLFLGSSCIYPRLAPQPIKEEYFLTGPLEPTNEAYAVAKIAGIVSCQSYRRQYGADFISVMPTNLYGENDNFDLQNSHVLPALIRKLHEAKERGQKEITLWGTGSARREFLHVDDAADAFLFLMERYDSPEIINVGTGEDVSIRDLAELVARTVGFSGKILWDAAQPDGMPRKLLDVGKLRGLGWRHTLPLEAGIRSTYEWYRKETSRR